MRPACPCKDCRDRELECHGKCERYKQWKKELQKTAEIRRAEKKGHSQRSEIAFWRKRDRMKK